jgi:predicted ATPase
VLLAWEMRSYHEAAPGRPRMRPRRGGWRVPGRRSRRRPAVAAAAHPTPRLLRPGIPDLVGYHPMMGGRTPAHFVAAAERFRYRRRVFVAPPWPEIYVNDAERKQDFAEAIRSYERVVDAYESCGYELVTLPKSTVDERVDFVLSRSALS